MYSGAIKSYCFSSRLRNQTYPQEFDFWLELNKNRVEERWVYHCIYTWFCPLSFDHIWTSNTTIRTVIRPIDNLVDDCDIVNMECFSDWNQRWFSLTGGGSLNWNFFPWVNNSSGGGTANGNNNPNIKSWEEQVLIDAKDCFQQAGINGARAMKALKDATDNSCGESYNDLLARTYLNIMDQGKSCTDSAALAAEVNNTVDKTKTVFFDDEVMEFFEENELIDPCSGEKISDMLKNEACANKKTLTMEALQAKLDAMDIIIEDASFVNCAALKCIYNHLKDSGSKMFCNNIYRFNYSDLIDLTIKVGTTFSNAEGSVSMSNNGTGVVMTFASYNCNWEDHIQLAETILHESIHAKFRFDNANNGTTEIQYRENFLKYVNEKYDIPYSEHQLMIKKYMEKLSKELWELNGKKFDPSYYMAWVWDGLKQYWPDRFSDSVVQDWNNKRNIVKENNPFKC